MQNIAAEINKLSIHTVLIVYNQLHQLHTSARKHPQTSERILAILKALQTLSNIQLINYDQPTQKNQLQRPTDEQIHKLIIKVQGEHYHDFIKEMWDQSCNKTQLFINKDTYFTLNTYKAAFQAIRVTIAALKQLLSAKYSYFYSIIRPPGHHSGMKSQPHGFCFFNNIVIAATYAIDSGHVKKVAIVDWDAHHGQGTQSLFYSRRDVLYLSLHRYDKGSFFPHVKESGPSYTGQKEGVGFNINIAWNLAAKTGTTHLRQETVGDEEYACAFRRIVIPVLNQFEPQLVLVSCGFDSGQGDSIGSLKISQYGFMYMTRELMSLQKPIGFVLEGGYNLEVLGWGSRAVVRTLYNDLSQSEQMQIDKLRASEPNSIGVQAITSCLQSIKDQWKLSL